MRYVVLMSLATLLSWIPYLANEIGNVVSEVPTVATDRGSFGYTTTYETHTQGGGHIVIQHILPGGPAAKAGLLVGDRITAVNSTRLHFKNELEMIRELDWIKNGMIVDLTVERAGEAIQVPLTAGPMSEPARLQLTEWLRDAEEWFENDGFKNCRQKQERRHIYNVLDEQLRQGSLTVVAQVRTTEPSFEFETTDGKHLPLELLGNPYFEASAKEISPGTRVRFRLGRASGEENEKHIIIEALDGPLAGRKGLLTPEGP